jgi:hypothetical protein
MRRRQLGLGEPAGQRPARHRDETRQPLGREALVRTRDRQQHGIADRAPQAGHPRPHQGRRAARGRARDQRGERLGRVVLVLDDQRLEPAASGVEHVARTGTCRIHVRHEGRTRCCRAQLADALEVGRTVRVDVEHHQERRAARAFAREVAPRVAHDERTRRGERGAQALQADVEGMRAAIMSVRWRGSRWW